MRANRLNKLDCTKPTRHYCLDCWAAHQVEDMETEVARRGDQVISLVACSYCGKRDEDPTPPVAPKLPGPRYCVLTWDMELDEFTPQDGVPSHDLTIHDVRRSLRMLRNNGYMACKGDASVLMERTSD